MHKLILENGDLIASGASGAAIKKVNLTRSVCAGQELTLGAVCAAVAQIELMDIQGACPLQAGDVFTLWREERMLGIFTVESAKRLSASGFSLTAYDSAARLDRNLDDFLSSLTRWPYTIEEFADMVCRECGVTLAKESLPDAACPVPAILGTGITGKQLLCWLGEILGGFFRARNTGELELCWYAQSDVEIGTESIPIYSGTLRYEDYETAAVDAVTIRKTDGDMGISYPQKGENPYVIQGNPILSGSEGDGEIAKRLYEKLKDISYCPFSAEVPVGAVEPGQFVTVHTPEGKVFCAPVMTVESQGSRDKIRCSGSQNRGSSAARMDFSLGAIAGKLMKLQTDLNGLRAENRDGEGKAAALQLSVEGLRAEVSRQEGVTEGLRQSVTQMEQTADSLKLQIRSAQENGAQKVTTSTGYTFDESGLHICKDGQEMENRLDHTGMYVSRSGETILRADASGVLATDVQVRNYLSVGEHARFQDYNGGTGCFYL